MIKKKKSGQAFDSRKIIKVIGKKPTIKCDIIDAKNILKLHGSDLRYFYKPDMISETDKYIKIVFKVPHQQNTLYPIIYKSARNL